MKEYSVYIAQVKNSYYLLWHVVWDGMDNIKESYGNSEIVFRTLLSTPNLLWREVMTFPYPSSVCHLYIQEEEEDFLDFLRNSIGQAFTVEIPEDLRYVPV